MAAATVLGVFAHVDTATRAIRELRARGIRSIAAYSPVPLDEFEEALTGHGLPRSPVRLFTLVGALTGTASGFALTIWTALKWNLITGGKPVVSIPPFVVIAFELTILLGGLCTLLGLLVTAKLPSFRILAPRPAVQRGPLRRRGDVRAGRARRHRASSGARAPRRSGHEVGVPARAPGRRRRGRGHGRVVAYRWMTSMQNDVKLVPGQITMSQPAGTVPREGAELVVAARESTRRGRTRSPPTPSRWRAGRSSTTSTARRATAQWQGRRARLPRFIPAPDLTSAAVQAKPDGHFSYYIGFGAIMPAYGEALSVTDRWDIVNHLRALAKK